MSQPTSLAVVRARRKLEADPTRAANQAVVRPADGDELDQICCMPDCRIFAEYNVSSGGLRALLCPYHLPDGIHSFFRAENARPARQRATWSTCKADPSWKDWRRAAWTLEYNRGEDATRAKIQFRTTWRDERKAEQAAYAEAMAGK